MNELIEKQVSWASRHVAIIAALFVGYAVLTLVAQVEFPTLTDTFFSPIEISLWMVNFASLAATIAKLSACESGGQMRRYWTLAVAVVAATTVIQSADWFSDVARIWQSYNYVNVTLSISVAAALLWVIQLPKERAWLSLFLKATVVFQCFSLLGDVIGTRWLFPNWIGSGKVEFSTEFVELLCVEFYLVALAFSRANMRQAPHHSYASGMYVGANARRLYHELNLFRSPKHPPIRLAFYPVFRELTVFAAAVWLGATSGPAIAGAVGRPVLAQIWDMLVLWFRDGIDPPSYYALEMFRAHNSDDAGHFLTRYETKNGLFNVLNKSRPQPFAESEMTNKALFAECCEKFGIPYPHTLLSVRDGEVEWLCRKGDLDQDLFCKLQNSMGAIDTLSFRSIGAGQYRGPNGQDLSRDEVLDMVRKASMGTWFLVQPWLKNHPSISDFAVDSLIAIRVVTCLNEAGVPEVTLAMLRVLAKLEPTWPDIPDEEYATPIDLDTGRMGLFTGDNMRTSHLRYEKHLVTGKQIEGRILEEWPAVRDLAIRAHAAFLHRVLIGWDLALTDKGPVVLEGNTNLDVMFLQRVHDAPAGRTRMGELMNYHLEALEAERLGRGA